MFKILLALILMTNSAWATQWRAGTGEQTILGSSNAADIDFNSYNSIVKPLDNLLANYCNEYLIYNSSSNLKVSSGSVTVSNSQGTIRLMLQDSAQTTISSANLDSGSLTANTTYYVYSTAATNSATASTYYISASNTAPSGQTYYYQIGSFSTDASNNINQSNIVTNQPYSNVRVLSEYDYGSSSSSYTNKTGGLKIAHGQTASMGFGSCASISNLPFSTSSSYVAIASSNTGNSSQNACDISSQAASTMSVCVVSVPSGSNISTSCNWMALGT